MKKSILSILLLASVASAAVEGDLDNNGAIDIGFGGTNAQTAGAARAALGLGNVNNTSDANKPISTLTQAALDAKAPLSGTVGEWASGRAYLVDAFVTYNGKLYKCLTGNTASSGNAPGVASEWEEQAQTGGTGSTNISVVAGSSSVAINSSSGTDATLSGATTIAAGAMTAADKSKLDGIAANATANSSDATLLSRANHTGTQASSTISDFAATVTSTMSSYITKLNGIATGAEVNVNADWNASSGDAQILNKPDIVSTDEDNTYTGQQTFEDIVLPKFDTAEFNVQVSEPTCSSGDYRFYFYGTKARQCINGTASDIGSGGSMTYPSSGNFGYTSNGTAWATMGLDTDLSSTSSNDDTVPSAKAVRTLFDSISASGLPTVTETPADAASGASWYNSTSNELCVAESAGISCVAMTYTADDNDPSNSTPWFTDETDVELNTAKTSNAITLAGLGARGASISVTGSSGAGYSKNSAGCTSSGGKGYNGDTVSACVTSSGSSSTATTATVTIGTDSDTYSVTTSAPTVTYLVYWDGGDSSGTQTNLNTYQEGSGTLTTTGTDFSVTGVGGTGHAAEVLNVDTLHFACTDGTSIDLEQGQIDFYYSRSATPEDYGTFFQLGTGSADFLLRFYAQVGDNIQFRYGGNRYDWPVPTATYPFTLNTFYKITLIWNRGTGTAPVLKINDVAVSGGSWTTGATYGAKPTISSPVFYFGTDAAGTYQPLGRFDNLYIYDSAQ